MAFLKGPEARAIIEKYGYVGRREELTAMGGLPLDIWQPVALTIELAAITTASLLLARHAARLVAGAIEGVVEGGGRGHRRRCRWCCRRRCSASIS